MKLLPSVAVVILNWNGKNFLEKFLPYVIASTYENLEIIIADNASVDDSVSFLQMNYPEIKIIQNKANEGFAKGYNTALKGVLADYYILLNSDIEVSTNWIEPVIRLMESDANIAACQPKILSYEQREQFEYAGACGGFIDKIGYPFCRGRIFETCETDKGQYDDAMQVFWASGAAMFVRAKVFNQLCGFDEYFFAHQEEIDLCWRMQRAGFSIYVEPASLVFHVGGGTLPVGNKRKTYLNFRNNLVMLAKNLPITEACWKIPCRLLLDVLAAYKSLFEGSGSDWLAIAKAHFHFIGWLFISKEANNLPKIKMKTMTGVYNGSIVRKYFIKKIKTFSEILPFKK